MTNRPKNLPLFLLLIAAAGVILIGILLILTKKPTFKENLSQERKTQGQIFEISGGEESFPKFVGPLEFQPYAVKNGETQSFSIWVEDPSRIKNVGLKLETDGEQETVPLTLIEKKEAQERWAGSWQTHNLGQKVYYLAQFEVVNEKDQKASLEAFFRSVK